VSREERVVRRSNQKPNNKIMRWLAQTAFYLKSLFLKRELDQQLSEEVRAHVEMATEANRAKGMKPDEARQTAWREFGNVPVIEQHAREERGWLWLHQFHQDLGFALRSLLKAPGFTGVAVLTIALGIGVTTSLFSVIYGVLLDPYPYAKSGEIWAPEVTDQKTNRPTGLRMTDYLEMSRLPGVASAMATTYSSVTLSGGMNPEIVTAPLVTGTAFEFLGVAPVLGRGLMPADIQPNGEPEAVTVLSFKFWQSRFNGDPGVVGRTVVLDDKPHVVVGVMPPRFGWYTNDGLWLPLSTLDANRGVRPIVRLKPGVSAEVADQQLIALMQEQARQTPGRFPKDGFTTRFNNYLNVTVASGDMRSSLIVLLCAVGFLLLIVCTNVANLQLARGVGRSREMAVRLALGAGRGRLVRQLLTESIALSVWGGLLGLLIAYGLTQIIVALMPENYVPNEARVTLNRWVLGFSAALAMLTGVLSGLVPGWQCTKPDVNEALKDGGQGAGVGSHRGNRIRNSLVVVEVALSVILLVGASLAMLSFIKLQRTDYGVETERMLMLRVPLAAKRYPAFEQRIGFARDFVERIRALPGVAHATVGLPPGFEAGSGVTVPGQPKPNDGLSLNYVDADYLATYGIALKAGRGLTEQDVTRGERVALISESVAKLWVNGESPLGRTIAVDALVGGGANNLPREGAMKEVTVVGIVADAHTRGRQQPAPATVFVPYTLRAPTQRAFVVRTLMEPAGLLSAMRAELRALDKEQPMLQPVTFDEIVEQQVKQPRFNMALFGGLAGIALVLAAAGIYGVLSYAVAQRSREIGLRMALGADRAAVLRLFLKLGGRLLVIGLVTGVAISLGLAKIVSSRVFGGPLLDPWAFAIAVLLLSATALLACYVPARRATKVDPMVALRAE
jgi:putative ABC transport system permease protein